ncbi:MAG: type II toxin-antitoxin system Phd/YefM family antitoxin [Desulfobulbaceae bacterium]|nr:type II toxin-antitoxin system Phd/YefM family antitoxin [Desulfobulbaceae bacterium]
MQTLSVREIRNQLGNLETLINEAHEIIITRHNKPLVRILPIKGTKPRPSHKALRASLPHQEINSETLQRLDREDR